MTGGQDLWKSLWADAQIVRYGPAGYLGPLQVYRSQVWVEQPEQKMVLLRPCGSRARICLFQPVRQRL
jgi:hypothetical protein